MENRAKIAMEANRRYVQECLDRRKLDQQLEEFEDSMIQRVNENCDNACWQRHFEDTARLDREAINARMNKRAEDKAESEIVRKDTRLGVLIFVIYGIVIAWLTSWTHLPVWAAIMYIASGALFLVLYLINVHGFPYVEDKK